MRLKIRETIDEIFYVDLIKDGISNSLCEDQILPDEEILPKNRYSNILDTRQFLALYLKPLAERIKRLRFIKDSYVHCPDDEDNDGLSNYVRIEFNHPECISTDEIHNFYSYSIRFSDHKHEKALQKRDVIDSQEIVGMKPKDFVNVGWDIFTYYVDDIKDYLK